MDYLQFAEHVAQDAGTIIRKNFTLGMQKAWKSDNTPVTETDHAINTLLLREVAINFSDHRVLAEEESRMDGDGDYVWVCDPVDGTIPFSHGIPLCMFSLALTYKGESILGVAYDPFGDRMFTASKNSGAHLNGKPIHVSENANLRGTAGEYEMYESAHFDLTSLATQLELNEGVKLMKFCSVVYPACLVAAGEFGFTMFPGTMAHDGAALKVIVEEAGGKVTDLFGNEQRYDQPVNGFLASNGVLHEKLLSLAKDRITKYEKKV